MKIKSSPRKFCYSLACAVIALTGTASADQLVTNGTFDLGLSDWAITSAGAGPFNPAAFPPLDTNVAFMDTGSQLIQTFTGVTLQPNFTYTISFDVIGSVGNFTTTNNMAVYLAYGSNSGSSSSFNGYMEAENVLSGSNFLNVVVTETTADGLGQSGLISFTTPGTLFGDAFTKDLAVVVQPGLDNVTGFQVYVDNVSVTAVPEPATGLLLAAGLGYLVFLRRRRAA